VGAGKISVGDTVHVCGTITVSGGSNALTFQGNGTAGNPITLQFELGAIIQAPYFGIGVNSAIYGANQSYVVVDGGLTSGSPNGIIRATANGTALPNQQSNAAIYFPTCNNCIVKNLNVQNIYVKTQGTSETACFTGNGCGTGIQISTGQANRITGNWVNDVEQCVNMGMSGAQSGIEIDHNKLWHCNWGVISGAVANMTVTNYSFHDNEVYDWQNWDDTATNNFHHNGIHVFIEGSTGAQSVSAPLFYNNYFHGDVGAHMTAQVFLEANTGDISNAKIFNNVFQTGEPGNNPTNGFVVTKGIPTNPVFYNNTFAYASNVGGLCLRNDGNSNTVWTLKNNIYLNCGQVYYLTGAGTSIGTSNYNDFYGNTSIDGTSATLAAWQAGGKDSNSIATNPNLTASYLPNAGSPAIGIGANLTSLGITALNSDKAGVARPSSGAWAIGAYEYVPPVTNSTRQGTYSGTFK
jgi:hypothetical protein